MQGDDQSNVSVRPESDNSSDSPRAATLFYDQPRLAILLLALVAVSGLAALRLLPRREDPELVSRFAIVRVVQPGASAERVEALVTEKLEDELREIEEIRLLESTSSTGSATVVLELEDRVTADDVDEVWSRVRDAVDDASALFPEGASEPDFDEQPVDAMSAILGLAWSGEAAGYGPAPMGLVSRLGEELADRLRNLDGTDRVFKSGFVDEELLVDVDPARLVELNLSVDDLAQRVAAADSKLSAGRVVGGGVDLAFEVAGRFEDIDRVRDLVVASGPNGQSVALRDVATISRGWRTPADDLAYVSGQRALTVSSTILASQRIDGWAERMRAEAADFAATLPAGVELRILFDQSTYTEERLTNLSTNLAVGAGLVVLVLLVMMGWRSAILVGLALPLSSLMVLSGMRFLGIPIHQMSVTGLIIALGLLIDNAIVIVDEVRHELHIGHSPRDAVAVSVGRLFVPLLGSTLTTVLAFMPIVLMPGPAGEFVGAIGITVSLALVSSFLLSMTIVATFAARFSSAYKARTSGRPRRGPLWLRQGLTVGWMLRAYRAMLGVNLAVPLIGALVCTVPSLLGLFAATKLEEQFFPPTDRDQFQVQLWMPQQSDIDETRAAMFRLREIALDIEHIVDAHLFIGRSSPKFYYNIPEGSENAAFYGQALIELDSKRDSAATIRELQTRVDRELPDAQVVARMLEQGPPFDAPVEVRIVGPDLDVLEAKGRELRSMLAAVPGVIHTRQTLDADRPKLELTVNEFDLDRAGLDPAPLAAALNGLVDGRVGGSLLEATEELPVRVRATPKRRDDAADLMSMPIYMPRADGERSWAPIAAFGSLELRPEFASIAHRNGERLTTVQGFLEAELLPSVGLDGLLERLEAADFELPAGYRLETGGESEERDQAVGNLLASAGVLMVLMAATLVLSFNSFRMAFIIAMVAPLSIGLGMGALFVFGYPFGFMAIIGSMGLVGVAINDSIVVLAAIRADELARRGDRQAVRDVVIRASRHVFSTTLTTMAGFAPLLIAGGQFWPPLAVAIGFGVTGATLLALGFVPAVYVLFHRQRALAATA